MLGFVCGRPGSVRVYLCEREREREIGGGGAQSERYEKKQLDRERGKEGL